MYGTIARLRAKPGMEARLQEFSREAEGRQPNGFMKSYVYRMDADPNEYYLVVLFDSRESYHANAANPEQNASFGQLMELLESEPEWHDGEVVYESR